MKGDTLGRNSPVLFLHGAGKLTSRSCFHPLRQELYEQQIFSAAFDFCGHGETGGHLEASSLAQRFRESSAVIEALNLDLPLSLVASSMSGYIAIKLLERYNICNLVLFVPAIYDSKAYLVPFNQGFSEIIRRHESWRNSDACSILEGFQRRLLLICAENDEVIPKEIPHMLYDSALQAEKKETHFIQKSPHRIIKFLSENPSEQEKVTLLIAQFLRA